MHVLSATYAVGHRGFVRWERNACSGLPVEGQEAEVSTRSLPFVAEGCFPGSNSPALPTRPASGLCARALGAQGRATGVLGRQPRGERSVLGPAGHLGRLRAAEPILYQGFRARLLGFEPQFCPTLLRAVDKLLDISEPLILHLSNGDSALLAS